MALDGDARDISAGLSPATRFFAGFVDLLAPWAKQHSETADVMEIRMSEGNREFVEELVETKLLAHVW